MPELPEVETVRRTLMRARPKGLAVSVWRSEFSLKVGRNWIRSGENLDALLGASVCSVKRRGKHLLVEHVDPTSRQGRPTLLVHLGMTGRLLVTRPRSPVVPHTHLVIDYADGRQIRYVDPRRFGGLRVDSYEKLVAAAPLCELGPEPLSSRFDGRVLAAALGRSKRVLRDSLLDQRVVAGVGNIYAVEALYASGLHPLLEAHRLRDSAWDRLAAELRRILKAAIDRRGTTLKDYRDASGRMGGNQSFLEVYGRAGQSCFRCGAELVAFEHAGRGGVYCPMEQRKPRTRRVP